MDSCDLSHCFGCGKDNPKGLHLTKKSDGNKAVMELTVDENHCGFSGILHGGITFTMMDEVMAYAIFSLGLAAVTKSVTVDFTSPGVVGHSLRAEGWVENVEGKYIEGASLVRDPDTGKCIARAHGSFKVVDFDKFGRSDEQQMTEAKTTLTPLAAGI